MDRSLLPLWFAVAWAVVGYLTILGLAALLRPRSALKFLSGFARNLRINALEAICRGAAGVAFMQLDDHLGWQGWGKLLGSFLVLTAALMLLFPAFHQRLAPRLVASVARYMPMLGLASCALATALAFALVGASG